MWKQEVDVEPRPLAVVFLDIARLLLDQAFYFHLDPRTSQKACELKNEIEAILADPNVVLPVFTLPPIISDNSA